MKVCCFGFDINSAPPYTVMKISRDAKFAIALSMIGLSTTFRGIIQVDNMDDGASYNVDDDYMKPDKHLKATKANDLPVPHSILRSRCQIVYLLGEYLYVDSYFIVLII